MEALLFQLNFSFIGVSYQPVAQFRLASSLRLQRAQSQTLDLADFLQSKQLPNCRFSDGKYIAYFAAYLLGRIRTGRT
jgi:hypothetical protein